VCFHDGRPNGGTPLLEVTAEESRASCGRGI
jgi:hypothetical protein